MPPDSEFQLTKPEDAARLWIHDSIHCPRALPPLCADLWATISSSGALSMDVTTVRGFTYMSPRQMAMPAPPEQLPKGEARRRWEAEYFPGVRGAYERVSARDYASLSPSELASIFATELPLVAKAFDDTLTSAGELGPDAERLSAFLESRFGDEGSLMAATILHGADTETASLGRDVQRLAEFAAATPAVAAAMRDNRLADAASSANGPWAEGLTAFLQDHRDELAIWSGFHQPAWNEDPLPLMRLVAATLATALRANGDAAERATAAARARLDPTDLAEFEEALALSRDYVPIIEDRARWQLKLSGALRRPLVALGKRLFEAGLTSDPADVFLLHLDEIEAAGNGSAPAPEVLERRKNEWAVNLTLTPPSTIGLPVPWEMIGVVSPMAKRMFGAVAIAAPTASVVSGIGASTGVVTGRARVVLGLEEAESLQDGDILVCPSTAPPWTPYFAVVSAIVTNSGGVLCHAAIAAREFGIPAVVGTLRATSLIPDGARVTVDGAAGTVTIG